MAAASYARALALVLQSEGGYVNDPRDPGGATMKGVTQAVYDAQRRGQGLALRSVHLIGADELAAIYRRRYADAVHFDELPAGVDYAVFDPAVNSGPGRGIAWLQAAVGLKADGRMGFAVLAAARARKPASVIDAICDARLGFLHRLRTWQVFGKGWGRRVYGVRLMAQLMARQAAGARPQPLARAA